MGKFTACAEVWDLGPIQPELVDKPTLRDRRESRADHASVNAAPTARERPPPAAEAPTPAASRMSASAFADRTDRSGFNDNRIVALLEELVRTIGHHQAELTDQVSDLGHSLKSRTDELHEHLDQLPSATLRATTDIEGQLVPYLVSVIETAVQEMDRDLARELAARTAVLARDLREGTQRSEDATVRLVKAITTTLSSEREADEQRRLRFVIDEFQARLDEVVAARAFGPSTRPLRLQGRVVEGQPAPTKTDITQAHIGLTEAAAVMGLSPQRATQVVANADFPEPLAGSDSARLWDRSAVEAWTDSHISRRPRRSGDVGEAAQ